MASSFLVCIAVLFSVVATVLSAPAPTVSNKANLQQDLKLLLDIMKIYTRLQVNRAIVTRNEAMKTEQVTIVKEFDQLLRHSSEIDNVVEDQVENASLPLLATKTIIDLTLNQSYHWLKASLGTEVTKSSLRQTAMNLDLGDLSRELSRKLRNPTNPSSIDSAVHCRQCDEHD